MLLPRPSASRPGLLLPACLLLACLIVGPMPARAEWKAVEKTETYAIAGKSGPELYASIGERGPKVGKSRAIAYTNFKLTWSQEI